MRARIIGTGSAHPQMRVTNEQLEKWVDTSDEWIASRTGIHSRYISTGETNTQLCVEAARKALQDAGLEAGELELIIVATVSPDDYFPNTGCQVQSILGADKAAAFELNAACSGFLFALNTAQAYIQAGVYHNALVIGAEILSKMIDWTDRSTCVLFGDGAGAAVVQADEVGMICFRQYSDGGQGRVLSCRNRLICNPFVNQQYRDTGEPMDHAHMEGQAVFRFAVRRVPEMIEELLAAAGMNKEEVDWYILHQANERILKSVSKRLDVSIEKFPMNVMEYGNTSAASVPILLDEASRSGLLKRGQKIILSGFGAGLTWAGALLEW